MCVEHYETPRCGFSGARGTKRVKGAHEEEEEEEKDDRKKKRVKDCAFGL